ncbi:type VI secretion system protein TssA [Pseudomonas sp. V1]|uniref:type VI secretion system protein TssA n=1 Tax=Pseudomonas arcuscaelestis TaxID=2710591 RepID=UPI00193F483B|nr:type VI secretion system protein TssA [Pseudomonas arcuscaelestis]MBM3108103.1 type VI secretion system protein TssA [Pseudomonas arcuscaelestis]
MTYSSKLSAHYLELANAAICEQSFAGEDVRFSGEFEALESELGKAQSMHEGGQVDWAKVLEASEMLLRTQSKDLRVAAWLTWALYQRESYQGLLAGVGLLHVMCASHWQQLHPAKLRTRSAAIGWLVLRLEQVLGNDIPIKEQLPLFELMVEYLQGLEVILAEHLAEEAPLLLPLCRRLKGMVQRTADNQAESGAVPSVVAQVQQVAIQLFSPGSPIDNEKDAQRGLRALQENARILCAWWLKQKATDPRALRLSRLMLWLPIDSLPGRDAEQVTALRGLPADKLKAYAQRYANGQYADLLVDLEASLAVAPFWFDGQRMAWECLQGLNAEQAMVEVEFHFALLLQRLPGLLELSFHDGVPFADAATRRWISAHVMSHLQIPSTPRKVEVTSSQPAWEKAFEEVMPVLQRDGLKAAVQMLKYGLQAAQGGRERFFWQLSMARLCFVAKKYELAKTQFESLDQELDRSGLNAWEPELALEVLHFLHSCCELLPQNHAVRDRREEIYRRLCHLDLEVVLE